MATKINWDALGIFTSIACAIHCALLPILLTSLSFFGVNIINNIFFEWGMILLAFIVGVYSLSHGKKKHHRSFFPLIIFAIGFAFLIAKQFFSMYEMACLTIAVVLIIAAHYYNYSLCHKSKCTSPHHIH